MGWFCGGKVKILYLKHRKIKENNLYKNLELSLFKEINVKILL